MRMVGTLRKEERVGMAGPTRGEERKLGQGDREKCAIVGIEPNNTTKSAPSRRDSMQNPRSETTLLRPGASEASQERPYGTGVRARTAGGSHEREGDK